ncbi:MAG: rhodanese-like domain-containing protein [Chloroflexi bacterium]|nr:rhodanese-like domain-containing protein [Chloroflexota bacterium]
MKLKNFSGLVLSVLLVIGVVLVSGCATNAAKTQNITTQEAHSLVQENTSNPDFVILDVRTQEEFDGGHLENAINLDFNSPTFRADLDKLNKQKTYLVYCLSGGRSSNAVTIMEELRFTKVYNMLNGILGWGVAGLPTVK